MSIDFVINTEHQLIIQRYDGIVKPQMVMKCTELVWEQHNYQPDFNVLADLRTADIQFTMRDFQNVLSFLRLKKERSKAMVVILMKTNRDVAQGMLFKQKIAELINIQVVTTLEGAFRCLGVEEIEYERINSTDAVRLSYELP